MYVRLYQTDTYKPKTSCCISDIMAIGSYHRLELCTIYAVSHKSDLANRQKHTLIWHPEPPFV